MSVSVRVMRDESILKVVVSGDPVTDQRGEESSIRALACTNVFWLVTVVGLGLQFVVSQVIQTRSQDLVVHRVLFSPVHLQCVDLQWRCQTLVLQEIAQGDDYPTVTCCSATSVNQPFSESKYRRPQPPSAYSLLALVFSRDLSSIKRWRNMEAPN